MAENKYDDSFFDEHFVESSRSAEVMLEKLCLVFRPHSVADFGCGKGAWLAAAGRLGATRLVGFDGPWVDSRKLADPAISFNSVDFSDEIRLVEKFDLAVSVEVAEHLPAARADWFVDTLCRASDVVVFGAAAPGQGGLNHVNEQWPSYWIEKFRAQGYLPIDFFRSKVWSDDRVAWYYRQNTLLYVKKSSSASDNFIPFEINENRIADCAHPVFLKIRQTQRDQLWKSVNSPTIFDCANVLANFVKTQIKRVIRHDVNK